MANNIDIGRTLESNLPTNGSGDVGKVYLTDKQNMYVIDNNKNKLKITDIIPVNALPSVGQVGKIYILNSSGTYIMNYYDGSVWHLLSGGSTDNQIKIQTSAPTDTTKLWIDITNSNNPILKYYNNTSWINISGSSTVNENKLMTISSTDWTLDGSSNTYKIIVTHNLNTKSIFVTMYDGEEQVELVGVTRIDNNSIQLENDSAINGELIINFSSIITTNLTSGSDRWKNRILNCLGDSITAGYGTTKIYHDYLKEFLGLTTVNNYGINGTKIASIDGVDTSAMSVRYTNMDNNSDIILVFGGTNDYGNAIPLGTYTDNVNTTFFGALNVLIKGLLNKYPSKTILFATPLQRNYTLGGVGGIAGVGANSAGFTLLQYVDAIIEVCGYYSIPVIDLYRNAGISTLNITNFSTDGLHPVAVGHERIAYKMASFINEQ